MMKRLATVLAAGMVLAATAAAKAESYSLTLCAASVGGTWSLIGTGIDLALKKSFPGSVVTIQTSPGGIANAATMTRGGCDISIMHAPEIAMALAGEDPFPAPIKELRLLARIESWSPLHVMVSQDIAKKYDLKTTADIAAKKAPVRLVLQKPGNIGFAVSRDALLESGVSIDDLKSWGGNMLHGASAEQANLIHDRRADGGMNVLFPGAAQVLDIAQGVLITLLSLPKDVVERISAKWSVPPFTIEKGTYPFVDHDIETVTLGAHLVALEKTSPEVVRALLTAITDNADQIASVHPSMKRLDTKQYSGASLPYHEAAKAFYAEKGMPVAAAK